MASAAAMTLVGDVLGGRARVHSLRAKASLSMGRHAEALEAVRRARRTRVGAEPGLLALEELDALAGLQWDAEALAVATRALRRRPADRDLEARLRVARGYALWRLGRVAPGVAEARKALCLATTELTLARANETLGLFAWKEQDLKRAEDHLGRAGELYGRAGSRDGLVRTLDKQGAVLRDSDRLEDALRLETLCVEIAATTTRLDALARARCERGNLLMVMGRWAAAREDLDVAADLFRRVSDPREFTLAGVNRASLDLTAGNLDAARAALDRAREVDSAERRDPRSLAEIELVLSDLALAEGDTRAAEGVLAEALGLFALVQDRVGECRARFRRSHVLLALGRVPEAVREARRTLRLATWPTRTDLRGAAELALGRALLRGRSFEAAAAFERAVELSAARPVVAHLARFGRLLARGSGRDAPEVREALQAVEAWGDRRLLAYCLADLNALLGAGATIPVPASGARSTLAGLCPAGRAIAEAAIAVAREAQWPACWAEAMRALRPLFRWHRSAWVAPDAGWELREHWKQPAPLAPDDMARALAEPVKDTALFDLAADPAFRTHPARLIHGLGWAVVAAVGEGMALYADVREDAPAPGDREADALAQVARLLALSRPGTPAPEGAGRFPEIVGRCPSMERLFGQMERLCASDVPVHVFGETGTGKEKVAKALHEHSSRAAGPFVPINASTLSDELFEAEMFGHTRGAFTGAVAERQGCVAAAEGGTLFLDEVTDLTPRAQAKLLRLLQEKDYRRLGETHTRRADVRFVTASNVRLEERVAKGLFREDLMYRLDVVVLALPPLRERGQDLLRLARHFLRRAAVRAGRPVPALPSEVAAPLSRYAWPGNVRELDNEMCRLVALAGPGPLSPDLLSEKIRGRPAGAAASLRDAVMSFERAHVSRVLEQQGGSRVRTAAALCVTRQALVAKIRRLGIS